MYSSSSNRSRRKEMNSGEVKFRHTNVPNIANYSPSTRNYSMEENSFGHGFRNNSAKGDRAMPIKRLLDEEVSNKMESKHSSPSLIARLMGLDTLPPPVVVPKIDKNINGSNKVAASERFQGNNLPLEKNAWPRRTNEEKEYKDVFQVEVSNIRKHKANLTRMEAISSKRAEADINLIRQKFTDVKRLSTDEALRSSKEFNEALEILDSNKDLLLEFLQDPNSLLGKHLHDMNKAQNPPRSQITLLRSSNGTKCRNNEVWSKFERRSERHSQPQNIRQPTTKSFREHNRSVPQKSSASGHGDKHEDRSHSTRIVVLKPSLEKAQRMLCDNSESLKKFQHGSRKYKEGLVSSGKSSHNEGGSERFQLFDNAVFMDKKTKTSREIARQVAREMNQAVSMHSDNCMFTEPNAYIRNDNSSKFSEYNGFDVSDSFSQLPRHIDMWNESLCAKKLCSTEPVTRREATQLLCERWKANPCIQEVGLTTNGVSTLGDMLSFCEETRGTPAEPLGMKRSSDEKSRNDGFGSWDLPLGISSKDGWFLQGPTKLSRSKSLPSSSTDFEMPKISNSKQFGGSESYFTLKEVLDMSPDDLFDSNFSEWTRPSPVENSKFGTRKTQRNHSIGEENNIPEREIHVNSEELTKRTHVRHLSEDIPSYTALSAELIVSGSDYNHPDEINPSTNSDERAKQFAFHMPSVKGELPDKNYSDVESEETSTPHLIEETLLQKEYRNSSSLSSNATEQPSPVSVLELQSEEESSSSGCFERVSADLQELRMQLKLLKLESTNTYTEDDIDVSSSSNCEQIEASNQHVVPLSDTIPAFRNEEERDFSYLLDTLIESGISSANQDTLSGFYYYRSCQIEPCVFDKLEKKYGGMVSWPRCGRMLLFDLIKHTLAGLETPCVTFRRRSTSERHMHTWDRDGLVEGLWQTIVKERNDIGSIIADKILDPSWIALEENINITVRQLERMLNDDLLLEIINDFIR